MQYLPSVTKSGFSVSVSLQELALQKAVRYEAVSIYSGPVHSTGHPAFLVDFDKADSRWLATLGIKLGTVLYCRTRGPERMDGGHYPLIIMTQAVCIAATSMQNSDLKNCQQGHG
jgi:hypothetical protein